MEDLQFDENGEQILSEVEEREIRLKSAKNGLIEKIAYYKEKRRTDESGDFNDNVYNMLIFKAFVSTCSYIFDYDFNKELEK